MNFTAAKDMWTLSYSDLQGLLPNLCQSAWFCWDYRQQPRTAWDSSEYEPSLEGKGCLPSRPKKKGTTKAQDLSFSFPLTTAAGIRNIWSKRKSSRNKIYPHEPEHRCPQGAREGCCLWRCSHFAYTVLPRFFHQSARDHFFEEEHRKPEKS